MTEIRRALARHIVPLAAACTALVAVVAVLVTLLALEAEQTEVQRDQVGNLAVEQAQGVEALCAAGGEAGAALARAGLCARAAEVEATVASAGVPLTITVPAAAVVAQEDLLRYVRDSVAAYCGARDGCKPPTSTLVELVADYLEANPAPPGRAPTEQEISDAAAFVLRSDPDLFRGEPGADASDEQVAAQVAAYCAARSGCRGEQGVRGPQGVGLESLRFARDDAGVCLAVAVLRDPADGTTRTVSAPAGDAACGPTTSQTPTTLPPSS